MDYQCFVNEKLTCDWYFKLYKIHSSDELVVNFRPGSIIATPVTDEADKIFWSPDMTKMSIPKLPDLSDDEGSDKDSSTDSHPDDGASEHTDDNDGGSSVNPLPPSWRPYSHLN